MKQTNKGLLTNNLFPLIFMIIGAGIYYISRKINFIPKVNDIFVIVAFISIFIGVLFMMYRIYIGNLGKWKKLILFLISMILAGYLIFITFVVGIFSLKNSKKFDYAGKEYYLLSEGFMTDHYVLFEKSGLITMDKIQEYYSYIPFDGKEFTEEEKAKLIDGTYPVREDYRDLN